MGSGRRKAAAVNLLVVLSTPRRDTVSKQTAAASTIEISEAQPILLLTMELGESGWLLGCLPADEQRNPTGRVRGGDPSGCYSRGRTGSPCPAVWPAVRAPAG